MLYLLLRALIFSRYFKWPVFTFLSWRLRDTWWQRLTVWLCLSAWVYKKKEEGRNKYETRLTWRRTIENDILAAEDGLVLRRRRVNLLSKQNPRCGIHWFMCVLWSYTIHQNYLRSISILSNTSALDVQQTATVHVGANQESARRTSLLEQAFGKRCLVLDPALQQPH